jgi:predicted DNA binding protein
MLGIGSRGITLADGTKFTVEEFYTILDRHDIPLEKFTEKEDITKERYKQVKYTEWKKSFDSELRELASLPDLTDREREGVRKMLKIYGT